MKTVDTYVYYYRYSTYEHRMDRVEKWGRSKGLTGVEVNRVRIIEKV